MFLQLFLLTSAFKPSLSYCDSNLAFCDCVTDLNNDQIKTWIEMDIGSEKKSYNCYSTTIGPHSFDNLDEIKRLSIVNQVNSIEPNSFENVGKTLLYLKFKQNNLTTIKRGTFSGFSKLNQLYLGYNNIEVLERNSFQDSNIKDLDLSHNKIGYLDYFTFDIDAKITRLFVNNNKLFRVLPFAFNENLQALYMDYNKIEDIYEFPATYKLKELTLSHNRLTYISGISSQVHLKKLDFSFNVIDHVSSKELEELKMLEVLNLSNNKLKTFSLKALKKMETNVTLLLSYNLLTNLEIEYSKPLTLTLFGNPWNCDCLEKMEKMMVQSNISRTKCDLERFSSGKMPICLIQGECKTLPVENNSNLRKFLMAVQINETCDKVFR